MSKAFTKEQEAESVEFEEAEVISPQGKNYMTPAGAKRIQDEFNQLKFKERPQVTETVAWAASNGDRSENADYQYGKKRLREIDRRLAYLSKRLQAMEVVDPVAVAKNLKADQKGKILFGATVTFRNHDDPQDRTRTYAIVGIDEADVSQGKISWVSPLAKALLKAKLDDIVIFNSPKGEQEIEVLEVKYVEIG